MRRIGPSPGSEPMIVAAHLSRLACEDGAVLIVISGLPGTGKTSVAGIIARDRDAVHLSIDAIEDTLLDARP